MLDYIGISLIILTTVGAVHYVFTKAFKLGKDAGINEGRMQVLQENLNRLKIAEKKDFDLSDFIDNLVKKESPKVEKVRG